MASFTEQPGTQTGSTKHTQATEETTISSAAVLADPQNNLGTQARECLQVAAGILASNEGTAAKLRRAAADIIGNAARGLPGVIKPALEALLSALTRVSNSAPVARRLRHTINTIVAEHGRLGHATLRQLITNTSDKARSESASALKKWKVEATRALKILPLSDEAWCRILTNISCSSDPSTPIDDAAGQAAWTRPATCSDRQTPRTLMSWNCNSFWKRLKDGDIAAMLQAEDPDVLHVSELKGSLRRTNAKELRAGLAELGYAHVAWNWCAKAPGNHGSAVFSKVPFQNVEWGLDGNNHDEEGRTITTHFKDYSVIWTYTPCSSMDVAEEETKRTSYDTKFKEHVLRMQSRKGSERVFVAGDRNVAPEDSDTSVRSRDQPYFPSNKPYERQAHHDLMRTGHFTDAATFFSKRPRHTWRQGRNPAITMRLDHLAAPRSALARHVAPGLPILQSFAVVGSNHNSDHWGIKWGMAVAGRNTLAPAANMTPQATPGSAARQRPAWADGGSSEEEEQPARASKQREKRPVQHQAERAPEVASQRRPWHGHRDGPLAPRRHKRSQAADEDQRKSHQRKRKRETELATRILQRDDIRSYRASRSIRADWKPGQGTAAPSRKELEEAMFEFNRIMKELDKEAEEAAEAAPAAAAAPPAPAAPTATPTLPQYRALGDGEMPHINMKIMPEKWLPVGEHRHKLRTLWDTGAYYNVMSQDAADRIGATLSSDIPAPLLRLADGHLARASAVATAPMYFGASGLATQFVILAETPYDIMMGSHFMHAQNVVIESREQRITLDVGHVRTRFSYKTSTEAPQVKDVAALCAAAPVRVPPFTNMAINLQFQCPRTEQGDVWGVIEDAGHYGLVVGKGLTCALNKGVGNYHCRVMNASARSIEINTTTPVALFKPLAEEYLVTLPQAGATGAGIWPDETADEHSSSSEAAPMNSNAPPDLSDDELDDAIASIKYLQELDLGQAEQNLDPPLFRQLQRAVLKHHKLWDPCPKEPPAGAHECTFTVKPGSHWTAKTRPMNPQTRKELRALVNVQLDKNILEPSTSQFSSPIVLVPKKGGGMRFAMDYRALNRCIDGDAYTLPRVDEALASLNGNAFFTALDMKEAFWSVPLAESCKQYTAFQTPDGLMQYRRMPMGLKTASAVFCRYVDSMLGELKWTNVLAYIDDLLIFGETAEEHLGALIRVLDRLEKSNLTLGAAKCSLFAKSVGFLGHVVTEGGVKPDPKKVQAIKALELPKDCAAMQSACGLFSYYRRFVKGYTAIERPLRAKLKVPARWRKDPDGNVVYTDEERIAFETLRSALSQEPVLAHPDWDQPFELHTDACYIGLGAALVQVRDGKEYTISFASRSLTAAESNYSVWELECLAIVWALRLFRMYLSNAETNIVTDSAAAANIMGPGANKAGGRLMRWALAVQEFEPLTYSHRQGKRHGNADGLSRNPQASSSPYGEGETVIEPATLLAQSPEAKQCFFGDRDEEASTSVEFAQFQATDDWCISAARKATTPAAETTPGKTYRRADGLLMRKSTNKLPDQVLVPECLRAFILRRYHGLPVSAHLGRKRTMLQVSASYYWPSLRKDLGRWINACLACRRRKTPRPLHAGDPGVVSNATRPWQVVAMDIVSAADTSAEGFTKILTMIDFFSRWVIGVPLKKANGKEVGAALFNNLFCIFGKPGRIHTDDGREFLNEAIKATCKRWGIEHTSTGGHQPQANPVERYHRFLNASMTMLSAKFGENWPEYLPPAFFAYNASTNDATGFSPYELIFAKGKATLLHDLGIADCNSAGTPNEPQFEELAAKRMADAYLAVREQQERLGKASRRRIQERRGVRQAKLAKHDIDDLVLFWEPAQAKTMQSDSERAKGISAVKAPRKWTSRWSGPHTISKRAADESGFRYTFFHKERGREIDTHVNKLCRFQPWSDGITSTSGDIDAKRLFKCGEWVENGALVVVPLVEPYPFGIAKVIDSSEDGALELQWWGNATNRTKGPYEPGWIGARGIYYAAQPERLSHKPYTAAQEEVELNQRDIVMHGFELTSSGLLPEPLVRAIARNPLIWWNKDT